ncbi:BTAD domain-containing putative transcriptional regulator [Mycobacterium sp. shizuoka-1]|uniref:ATP-binding protein n=1 Tax=Mycobacterium sp. shizuoka-1 TaxID=2039281 RepID=UPI001E63FC48|nr:BTAD domain-containing putative transcriptional regulator [Mycobacterium sp. shizuoka-1]
MTSTDEQLRFQILGPLRIWRGDVELEAGPRQQLCLLAVLLARAGQPMSTGQLIDLIWGNHAPDSALNVIHKYVGALRRVFEPSLSARSSGAHLFRHGNGYLFTPGPAILDLTEFQRLVQIAKLALGDDQPEVALDNYDRALSLWKGAAGDGLDHGSSVAAVFATVNNCFFEVCVAASELAVSQSSPHRITTPLRLAAEMAPLNEPVHAALISLLGAAGQQAEALELYRLTRQRLADELGIDPGQALLRAHQRVLTHHPVPSSGGADRHRSDPPASAPVRSAMFVGRLPESAAVSEAMDRALAGGTGLVLIEGEPGIGKTRLLEETCAGAGQRGALIAWGNSPPSAGTPAMWPWVQAIGAVLADHPEETQRRWRVGELGHLLDSASGDLPPLLPDSGARFRLFERVTAVIREAAAARPVVLVIDDLHWADLPSLELFAHMASRLPDGVALVGALRDKAPVPRGELTRMLASASRVPGVRRVRLEPLSPPHVADLIRIETGREPSADEAGTIHGRTAGNPFFVRELSRLLATRDAVAGGTASHQVPATVRDIVLDRVAEVTDVGKQLLFTAALIGRDVELRVLAPASGLALDECLDHLEPLDDLGLLTGTTDPLWFSFVHDLVRDAVIELMPAHRASRLHARIADALESRPLDGEPVEERLAHHLRAAGPCVEPDRTVDALMRAAALMVNKCAFEAAEQNLHAAVTVSRQAALAQRELAALAQLTAMVGMRSMYGSAGLRDLLERAEQVAASLGRERDAAGFRYSRWASHAQALELDTARPLAQRLLEQGCASADPVVRSYGLQAWGIQQWNAGEVGEAYRHLERCRQSLLEELRTDIEDPVCRDLQWLMTGMLAETTALHGDIASATSLFDALRSAAGDEPYLITVWATMACRVAALAGDPHWAHQMAALGIAVDPGFHFTFLGTYLRLAGLWAAAMTGDRPGDSAADAERLIATNLLDPPRSCVATWYVLLAEMWLEAEDHDQAERALDRAEQCMHTYGQRYPEGLLLVMRARLLHARGARVSQVRAAAQHARSVSEQREAHLFAQRAQALLDELVPAARRCAV